MPDSAPRPEADEEWDALLRQWRRRPGTEPRPFLYSRVRARLDQSAAAGERLRALWLRRSAYAAVLGALVLALSGDRPASDAAAYDAGTGHAQPALPSR